jgi:hypothetical protein
MRPIFKSAVCLTVWCLAATALHAAEGVQIVQRTTIDGATHTSQLQISRDRMRADVPDSSSGAKQIVIFDAARQVIDLVNVDGKTYMEVTKEQIDQLGAQMQDMMGQMQAAMANMPPAQRAQMEAMMRGRGMGAMAAPAVKTEYRKTGTERVGQWTCDKYEGTLSGQKVSEVCAVDPAALGLAPADMQIMGQLASFFRKLVPQGAAMLNLGSAEDQGFPGVPVKSVTTVGGKQITSELAEVSRQTFPDALFQVPAGFQKQDFAGMGRR